MTGPDHPSRETPGGVEPDAGVPVGPRGGNGARSAEDRMLIWAAVVVLAFGLAVTAYAVRRHFKKEAAVNRERWLADFELTDRSGEKVTRDVLGRRFLVVNFVFTSCSLSCLQVNRHLARIQDRVADQDDVRLVSITVDPRTDTPPLLAGFANQFGARTNRWYFLTGDPDAVDALLTTSFLDRGEVPVPEAGGMPGGYLGTELIAIVDLEGRVRKFIDGLRASSVDRVLETLEALRQEKRR